MVIRTPDGDWQFLCGKNDHTDTCHTVGVGHLLDRDSSLGQLANLQLETGVERETTQHDWKCFELDE